jgi:threonyl-tRNA synthetase
LQNKIIKVSVRTREGEDLGQIELYKFIEDLRKKLETFS